MVTHAPLAQLVRALGLHPRGRRFESYREHSRISVICARKIPDVRLTQRPMLISLDGAPLV